MVWTYLGYLAAFYVALACYAVVDLPSHSRPGMGAFAYLVLAPSFVAAVCAEILILPNADDKEAIRQCFAHGSLSRAYAFRMGLIAGFITVAAMVAAWFGLPLVVQAEWVTIVVVVVLVPLGAVLAGGWLVGAAKTAAKDAR